MRDSLFSAVCCVLFTFFSCTVDLAGGIEIGNPLTVTGSIVDTNGKPVKGARVFLVSENFNPVKEQIRNQDVTDSLGRYEISEVISGEYNLNSVDDVTGFRVLKRNISVSQKHKDERSDTILAPGNLQVPIADSSFEEGMRLFIPGTEIFVSIEGPGIMNLQCPAGTVDLFSFSTLSDTILEKGPNFRSVPVKSGEQTVVNHSVSVPSAPTGKKGVVSGEEQVYITGGSASSFDHEVEYRFAWVHYVDTIADYWSTATIGNWSSDTSITLTWPTPGLYKVRAQARSKIDTAFISSWSPYLQIALLE